MARLENRVMIECVLVANRGEIALRVLRTCREMGIRGIAVYSDADVNMPYVQAADLAVRLGAPPAAESYLDMEKILAIALGNGVDAIHPGYGFLSENAEFSKRCGERGVTFIGPPPKAITAMGDKAQAKRIMDKAGVPILPGYMGDAQDAATLSREAGRVGYPLLLKAVAGGGGRGIRLVERESDLPQALESAQREAVGAFKDGRVMLEKFLPAPHHVEFQIMADTQGTVIHLFERECSVQRRHQKIVEETPSPLLTPDLRQRMGAAAIAAAAAVGYVGAGTVEFLVDGHGHFYFLEMNTRLQVEHPVTEMTLGLDLVRMQIEVAEGKPLAVAQADLRPRGHAIECRLNAENPAKGFLPSVGDLRQFAFPAGPGLRVDSGFAPGGRVSPYYDSLLAKLIAWGADRGEALRRMRYLLAHAQVTGIPTNLSLLQGIVSQPDFAAGKYSTQFMELHQQHLAAPHETPAQLAEQVVAAAVTEVVLALESRPQGADAGNGTTASPWARNPGWPANPGAVPQLLRAVTLGGHALVVSIYVLSGSPAGFRIEVAWGGQKLRCAYAPTGDRAGTMDLDGVRVPLRWDAREDRRWIALRGVHAVARVAVVAPEGRASTAELGERLRAPLPGKVIKISVTANQRVSTGDVLLVLEAMKVEHAITAPFDGTVKRLPFREGDLVQRDDQLIDLEPATP
jgi:3-methylcrotonyl-CoA carboxylase alpha subunit